MRQLIHDKLKGYELNGLESLFGPSSYGPIALILLLVNGSFVFASVAYSITVVRNLLGLNLDYGRIVKLNQTSIQTREAWF